MLHLVIPRPNSFVFTSFLTCYKRKYDMPVMFSSRGPIGKIRINNIMEILFLRRGKERGCGGWGRVRGGVKGTEGE